MHIDKLQYLFDPLCGWCYASAPALNYLARHHGDRLELMPSGLFCDEGARLITAQWAAHAWSNDQRISSLTGQPFSEGYHELLFSGARFDSTYMTRALTVFQHAGAAAEAALLHKLQHARYVLGRDTSRCDVVTELSTVWAQEYGIDHDDYHLSSQLEADAGLCKQTDDRIARVQQIMNEKGIRGVPLLLVTAYGKEHVISGYDLYGGEGSISTALAALA